MFGLLKKASQKHNEIIEEAHNQVDRRKAEHEQWEEFVKNSEHYLSRQDPKIVISFMEEYPNKRDFMRIIWKFQYPHGINRDLVIYKAWEGYSFGKFNDLFKERIAQYMPEIIYYIDGHEHIDMPYSPIKLFRMW